MYRVLHYSLDLMNPRNLRISPTLFLLAAMYWLMPLPVIFPSGAIIVKGQLFSERGSTNVPTFDPAFLGNGSVADVQANTLAPNVPANNESAWGGDM